jgi:nitrous oxide reductase accessory protein NosL
MADWTKPQSYINRMGSASLWSEPGVEPLDWREPTQPYFVITRARRRR